MSSLPTCTIRMSSLPACTVCMSSFPACTIYMSSLPTCAICTSSLPVFVQSGCPPCLHVLSACPPFLCVQFARPPCLRVQSVCPPCPHVCGLHVLPACVFVVCMSSLPVFLWSACPLCLCVRSAWPPCFPSAVITLCLGGSESECECEHVPCSKIDILSLVTPVCPRIGCKVIVTIYWMNPWKETQTIYVYAVFRAVTVSVYICLQKEIYPKKKKSECTCIGTSDLSWCQ